MGLSESFTYLEIRKKVMCPIKMYFLLENIAKYKRKKNGVRCSVLYSIELLMCHHENCDTIKVGLP